MAIAVYNVPPGPNITLAAVLTNGNDAGTSSITANSAAQTIWNATNTWVPNASVQGNVNLGTHAFSAYPLVTGTDLPAKGVSNYLAPTDPAAQLSAYPLVPGTDVTNLDKVQVKTVSTLLATTSATSVMTYTPAAAGIFFVRAVVTVITLATTLTLQATWTDDSSSVAQTYTWENLALLTVGTRLEMPLVISASAAAITVTATAGTASQIYIGGSIEELV